ncbi:MAG: hypothetical protein WA734_10575 [Candidatus Acidiferrales bacterium]
MGRIPQCEAPLDLAGALRSDGTRAVPLIRRDLSLKSFDVSPDECTYNVVAGDGAEHGQLLWGALANMQPG